MNKNKFYDVFGDGMRIFLDYIARQEKKDNDYLPHPIIRAFEVALATIDKIKVDENTMGVSTNKKDDKIYEPYAVILKKLESGIEVLEIKNMQVNKSLPVDILVIVFRIQIQLDKIDGEDISPQQFTDILNHVIPGNRYYFLGDEWKLARDEFNRVKKQGGFHVPEEFNMPIEYENIDDNTPWHEYPRNLRLMIGPMICPVKNLPPGTVVISSPIDSPIEKYKVFETAIETTIGKSSEYLQK